MYLKIHKNQTLWFSSTFMTPGTGKSTKIRRFDFLQFSWPRVHENPQKSDTLIFFNFHDLRYMKLHKSQTLWFYSIFMTPGTWKLNKIRHFDFNMKIHKNQTLWFYSTFMTPGTWKSTKIRILCFLQLSWPHFDFIHFSCTRGQESWRKLKRLILFNFHDPGYISSQVVD